MTPKGSEIVPDSGNTGKELVNKDGSVTKLIEWATQHATTPEEIVDLFAEFDVPVSHGEELTGEYVVVHGEMKEEWCTKHEGVLLALVQWNFYTNATGEFVSFHCVSSFGKWIVNDSAKGGMYGQLLKLTEIRELKDPESAVKRTSTAGAIAPRGLRRNKPFYYNTETKTAIPRLELDDVVKHPMNKRELSKPTWSFDF